MEEFQSKRLEEVNLIKEEKRQISKKKKQLEEDQLKLNALKRDEIFKQSELAQIKLERIR